MHEKKAVRGRAPPYRDKGFVACCFQNFGFGSLIALQSAPSHNIRPSDFRNKWLVETSLQLHDGKNTQSLVFTRDFLRFSRVSSRHKETNQPPKGIPGETRQTTTHHLSSQVNFIYIALLTIQIVTKQLHNIKIGKLCVNNVKWQDLTLNFQFNFHYWILWWHHPSQFSLNSICAIKSMISLEMKCPQLSKPEATAARNKNSICERMEKKPWEKPGSVGGPVSLWPDELAVCFNCSKVRL